MERIRAILEEAEQIEAMPLDNWGFGSNDDNNIFLPDPSSSALLPPPDLTMGSHHHHRHATDVLGTSESSPSPAFILPHQPTLSGMVASNNATTMTFGSEQIAAPNSAEAATAPPKKQYWKKPKDMPRRPLSAYNLFFQSERQKLVAAAKDAAVAQPSNSSKAVKKRRRKSKHTNLGIGFAGLARKIAKQWKELNDMDRSVFETQARAEKERYKKAMVVWKSKNQEQIKEKERMKIKAQLMAAVEEQPQPQPQQDQHCLRRPSSLTTTTAASGPSSVLSTSQQQQQNLLRALSNAEATIAALRAATNKTGACQSFPTAATNQPSLMDLLMVRERQQQQQYPSTMMDCNPVPTQSLEESFSTLQQPPLSILEIPSTWVDIFPDGHKICQEDDTSTLGTVDCFADSLESDEPDEFEQFMESIEAGNDL